jgi:DNA polymerase-3 subunit beta
MYSVAKSEIKPEISGVFVKFVDNNIYFVATDAYRLAEKKIDLEDEVPELSFIIPEKNVKDMLRIVDNDYNGKLSLVISKNSLQIKENNTFFVSRLIEGNFPNYTQIIPSTPVSFAIFLKEDLVKSLRIVSFFSDKTQQISLNITEQNTEMEANNNEVGSTKETLSSTLKGDPFTLKINSKYLEEFLQNISDTSVVMKFTAQNKAIIVQGIQDTNYTYLLMPSYR